MCFRPAHATGPQEHVCPECGVPVVNMGGIAITSCLSCGCDFTPYLNGEKAIPAAAAPKAPGAPAPQAPTAPKPPVA